MQATRIPTSIPFPTGAAPRSEGVHLSGLLRSMAVDYGFLDKKWVEDLHLVEVDGGSERWWGSLDEDSQIRMSIGLAWEAWYLPQIPNVIHQPGELLLDGIYMTPDGQSLDAVLHLKKWKYTLALHEVKTTSKSINTVGDINLFNAGNWMWLTQTACYCKAAGTTRAYLHILYLYGDYRPPKPQLHVWQIEFTQEELDKQWAKITDYRDQKIATGALR